LSELNIVAYPNPVTSQLTITGLSTASNNIEIYAYNGKLLKSFDTKEVEAKFDFSSFSDGVYFVRILNSENNYSIKKVIKKQ
jgi:hypothetical protein